MDGPAECALLGRSLQSVGCRPHERPFHTPFGPGQPELLGTVEGRDGENEGVLGNEAARQAQHVPRQAGPS